MAKRFIPKTFTKTVSCASTALALSSAITKEDIIFILSLLVMLINGILEYLRSRNDGKKVE